MSDPVFDPNKDVMEIQVGSKRYLSQDGFKFTYSTFYKSSNQWEPFPEYVPDNQASFEELKTMAQKVLDDTRLLRRSIDAFTYAVNSKIGLGDSQPIKPTSTSPYEDAYLNELPPMPDLVESLAEESKKKRLPPVRKRSGGRPKKVV